MKKGLYYIFIILTLVLLSSACKEKERSMDASSDMLFTTRKSEILVQVNIEDTKRNAEVVAEITKILEKNIRFVDGRVFEMKTGKGKAIDAYENFDAFKHGSIKSMGNYSFAEKAMFVTFYFPNDEHTFGISGYFGNGFYNHFLPQEGAVSHIVEASKVFCLSDSYTETLKEKYPELTLAEIKTDMMTLRPLETFK